MKQFALLLATVLPLLASAPGHAQKLEVGTWTGSVTPPGEQVPENVTYEVALKGDTVGITVNAGEHGSFPFRDIAFDGGTLTFWFMPGPRVDCTLTRREDGVLHGSCRDTEGGTASMVMIPPRKE